MRMFLSPNCAFRMTSVGEITEGFKKRFVKLEAFINCVSTLPATLATQQCWFGFLASLGSHAISPKHCSSMFSKEMQESKMMKEDFISCPSPSNRSCCGRENSNAVSECFRVTTQETNHNGWYWQLFVLLRELLEYDTETYHDAGVLSLWVFEPMVLDKVASGFDLLFHYFIHLILSTGCAMLAKPIPVLVTASWMILGLSMGSVSGSLFCYLFLRHWPVRAPRIWEDKQCWLDLTISMPFFSKSLNTLL